MSMAEKDTTSSNCQRRYTHDPVSTHDKLVPKKNLIGGKIEDLNPIDFPHPAPPSPCHFTATIRQKYVVHFLLNKVH
jgi:hypothetical protein